MRQADGAADGRARADTGPQRAARRRRRVQGTRVPQQDTDAVRQYDGAAKAISNRQTTKISSRSIV